MLASKHDQTLHQQDKLEQQLYAQSENSLTLHLLTLSSMNASQKHDQHYDVSHKQNDVINQAVTTLKHQVEGFSATLRSRQVREQTNTNGKVSSIALRCQHSSIENAFDVTRMRLSRPKIKFHFVPFAISIETVINDEENTHCRRAQATTLTHIQRPCRERKKVEFRVPRWFLESQYTICLRKSPWGWSLLPRVYRDVPDYTEFLLACMNGPYEKAERLLKSNKWVLLDRSGGMTGADVLTHLDY